MLGCSVARGAAANWASQLFLMYRIFIVKRRGGQFELHLSQNVLQSVRMMNRRLEKQGKKKWDLWQLVWFSKPDQMYAAQKLMAKLLRCGGWTAMQPLIEEHTADECDFYSREKIAEI